MSTDQEQRDRERQRLDEGKVRQLAADLVTYGAARQPCTFAGCTATYRADDVHPPTRYVAGYTGWRYPGRYPENDATDTPVHDHVAARYATIPGPPWPDLPADGDVDPQVGQQVRYHGLQPLPYYKGRTGTVVGWGVSPEQADAFAKGFIATAGPRSGERIAPGDYEMLCDSEGPVVRWDDDGSLDWYPGQSMGALDWPGGWSAGSPGAAVAPGDEPGDDAMRVSP